MFNLNIVVSVFLNKKLRNGNVRLCNLLIANFMALILSGCASVEYFRRNDQPDDERMISGRETYPWAVMNITRSEIIGIGYLGWKGGAFPLLLWAPLFAVDVPISLFVDTVTAPWQIQRYSDFPDEVNSNDEKPRHEEDKPNLDE